MIGRRSLLAATLALAALAACSSPEPRAGTSGEDAPASVASGSLVRTAGPSTAPVSSAAALSDASDETPAPAAARPGPARDAAADAGAATAPAGATPAGSERARRERVIEEAADEDRPAGRSEARFEPDGAAYKPGVGLLPRYTLRAVDRKSDAAPDPIAEKIEKALPGSRIDLPPPPAKKPAVVQKAAEVPDEEMRPIKPKPVD